MASDFLWIVIDKPVTFERAGVVLGDFNLDVAEFCGSRQQSQLPAWWRNLSVATVSDDLNGRGQSCD